MNEIRTERLLLRRAKWSDLEAMHAVLSDARSMRYWSSLPHRNLHETREWLADMIDSPAELRDDYVVERDGEVIGKAGCWRLPEVGFILRSDCWGNGYGREALSAVIAALFSRHSIPAIIADVDPRNRACLCLLERLGFEETGRAERTWKIGEEWCDSIYLALTRNCYTFRESRSPSQDGAAGPDRIRG